MAYIHHGRRVQQSKYSERVSRFWVVVLVIGVIIGGGLMFFKVIKSPGLHHPEFTTPAPQPSNFTPRGS